MHPLVISPERRHIARMCQMVSPERVVLWSALYSERYFRALEGDLRAAFFTHPGYRRWYEICRESYKAGQSVTAGSIESRLAADGDVLSKAERRALQRMFKVAPPARVRGNLGLLAQALADRHAGRPVHMEKLQN